MKSKNGLSPLDNKSFLKNKTRIIIIKSKDGLISLRHNGRKKKGW